MKCVRDMTGVVNRIKDKEAVVAVSTGKWKYCPKLDWRKYRAEQAKKLA